MCSFRALVALAQGSSAEFTAHVDAEVRSADDQLAAPPTKVSFLGLNGAILLGMSAASDARLAEMYGVPAASSWTERFERWGPLAVHDP